MEELSHGSGTPPAPVQLGCAVQGGEGEGSYSRNSQVQRGLGACLQPSLQDMLLRHFCPPGAGPILYADFGCAVGANTIDYAKFVYEILSRRSELNGRDIVCPFADLPSNDFNTLSNQLPPPPEQRTWFADGVPGSQFGRMFSRALLHVAISTLSLQFLSGQGTCKLPWRESCGGRGFCRDLEERLAQIFECRPEGLAPGGVLALLCTARRNRAHLEVHLSADTINFIPVLEKTWKELIHEGVIAGELLDSCNIPQCSPSVDEILEAIEHPTSAFRIQKLERIEDFRPFPDDAENTIFNDTRLFANLFTNASKSSGTGSMLAAHLGPELTDLLFERSQQDLEEDYPKWKAVHLSMTLCLCMAVHIRM